LIFWVALFFFFFSLKKKVSHQTFSFANSREIQGLWKKITKVKTFHFLPQDDLHFFSYFVEGLTGVLQVALNQEVLWVSVFSIT